ncbi:MAG: prepilin-type N-terminal cleavage/methylation domain-containing protein [Acidobacteriota bacterium]
MFEQLRRIRYRSRGDGGRQAGFSLIELLVSMVIMVEVLIGLLIIFDSSSRLARAQTHLAELQQSLRVGQAEIVRYTRMAGLGGLPVSMINLPTGQPDAASPIYDTFGIFPRSGYAVSVLNNAPEETIVGVVDPMAPNQGSDTVLPGSDVLILRGVFTTPMYYLDPPLDVSGWIASDQFSGKVILPERSRISGRTYWDYPQEIDELSDRLKDAKSASQPLALLMRDTLNPNAYVVAAFDFSTTTTAELDPAPCPNVDVHDSTANDDIPQCISFNVVLDPDQDTTTGPGAGYADLTTGSSLQPGAGGTTLTVSAGPPAVEIELPSSVGSIGLLEEYRLFVRAEWEVPGDDTTRLTPVLSRARFFPGTDTVIDRVDVADNVLDLQIAIGADTDARGAVGHGEITDDDDNSDEILFNVAGDTTSSGSTNYTSPQGTATLPTWYDTSLEYHYLRINTLVQARFPDLNHRAPLIQPIEDYDRGAAFTVSGKSYTFNSEVQYHRRWLQTIVELRNLQ